VANLRLLQLQPTTPDTLHEQIIAAWHEDVVGELTKAYLTERLQTRSLFDIGWKRNRDGGEDVEAVEAERLLKRVKGMVEIT